MNTSRIAIGFPVLLLISLFGPASLRAQAIAVSVDASHAPQKVLKVHLELPVHAGPLTLYYPKWIPGMHQPAGPIANVAGLQFSGNDQSIPWRRDLLDVFTFHVDVPSGVTLLKASFDYLEPTGMSGALDGMTTDKLLVLNWNQVVLYPAGTPASKIIFKPALQLPPGWKYGTALHGSSAGGDLTFEPVPLTRLIDSPLVAGQYYRNIDLTPPGEAIHHEIDIVADSEAALAMPADLQKGLTNVVAQSGKLFGSRHYSEYHFLLTLSDHTAHFGVEHHESNDSRLEERAFLSPTVMRDGGALLSHEFAHSWCGKFRRPAGEDVADYQVPMQTDMLWVYEGGTSYFGDVLAARSGLWSEQDYREAVASYGANLGFGRPGRTWRPVIDTAAAVPGMFHASGWLNWRRGSDYYEEGELIWLEVAAVIHQQSHGQKTFDDFARLFYGGTAHGPEMKPYTFEDVTAALNQTVPYQWADLLNKRLNSTSPDAPVAGIEASGWNLAFTAEPMPAGRSSRGVTAATYSLGLSLAADGTVSDAVYDGLAAKASISQGMRVVGVNGHIFTLDVLSDVIKSSNQENAKSIELLVIDDDYYRSCRIDYHGGERYPHLKRDAGKADYLAEILKPLN